jgi:hypothetical protein
VPQTYGATSVTFAERPRRPKERKYPTAAALRSAEASSTGNEGSKEMSPVE